MKKILFILSLFGLTSLTTFGAKLYFGVSGQEAWEKAEVSQLVFPQNQLTEKIAQVESIKIKEPAFNFPYKIKAPDLVGLENWLNSEPINSLEELKGKVVYLKFWTYSCPNCIHTFPEVQALHENYADEGLVVLGIHAPEFQYEKKIENVRAQVIKNGLTFPVVQDNDFQTWRAYNNRYWPAIYLIDKDGYVRYTHFGQGNYEEIETAVKALLEA